MRHSKPGPRSKGQTPAEGEAAGPATPAVAQLPTRRRRDSGRRRGAAAAEAAASGRRSVQLQKHLVFTHPGLERDFRAQEGRCSRRGELSLTTVMVGLLGLGYASGRGGRCGWVGGCVGGWVMGRAGGLVGWVGCPAVLGAAEREGGLAAAALEAFGGSCRQAGRCPLFDGCGPVGRSKAAEGAPCPLSCHS